MLASYRFSDTNKPEADFLVVQHYLLHLTCMKVIMKFLGDTKFHYMLSDYSDGGELERERKTSFEFAEEV